ncbi:hypothetical protein JK152_10655 [Acinetobacter nectaris]|nr:hypothetical protein [Acinetobacter nectaris]MCF8999982.1 hypothetical protein [Acinetobacter nectaris]MCF9028363.1 hypothetical protein [Acinetobacter nectaris]
MASTTLLTDDIWQQIMEAILWKIRTGVTFQKSFALEKIAYNRFNRWTVRGLWDKFF